FLLSLFISVVTAALVYVSIQWLAVRPMRRLTASMTAFQRAPEDPERVMRPGGRRDEVGVVFQSFHLIPTMTAQENVAVPMELAGRADAFVRAAETLAEVGLGERLLHYPGQLSGGEQQRVALARAFASEPHLLLADEPTGNLDGETGARIVEMMFGLAARNGTTLMLITHDPAIAARCDRIVRMVDGQIAEAPQATAAGLGA
ncbi:MAG: ATP-binding cassette domain-containing protein, partial [Rickettsiales bacterium]